MIRSPNHRNTLGPAHAAAESLYDNAVALSQLLDAWSKRHRAPDLTPDAAGYLTHNLINAQSSLDALRQALADWLDAAPVEPVETSEEEPWPANADSAAAAAPANSPTPPAPQPAAPSGTNETNGGNP